MNTEELDAITNLSPYISFFASIIGGIIAGCFTLIGVMKTHANQIRKMNIEEQRELTNIQIALSDELKSYWTLYLSDIKKIIHRKENEYVRLFLPQALPFTVYAQSAKTLGKISDGPYRTLIVEVFTAAEIFSDLIKWHNVTLEKYENIYWESQSQDNDKITIRKINSAKKSLLSTSNDLREHSGLLEKKIIQLMKKFKEHTN